MGKTKRGRSGPQPPPAVFGYLLSRSPKPRSALICVQLRLTAVRVFHKPVCSRARLQSCRQNRFVSGHGFSRAVRIKSTCHLDQARRSQQSWRTEGAWRDPEGASSAMPTRGVLPKLRALLFPELLVWHRRRGPQCAPLLRALGWRAAERTSSQRDASSNPPFAKTKTAKSLPRAKSRGSGTPLYAAIATLLLLRCGLRLFNT